MTLSDFRDRPVGFGHFADGEREPGDEAEPRLIAVVEHLFPLPVGQVVAVLHGDDRQDRPGSLDLRDRHL